MMPTDATPTPPALPTTNPTWEQTATHALAEVSTFLRSRKKSLTINMDLAIGKGFSILPEAVTYTLAQVQEFAVDICEMMSTRKDCSSMPVPSEMGRIALAKYLTAASTYSGISKPIAIRVISSFRWSMKRTNRANRLAEKVAAGEHWFADDVRPSVKNADGVWVMATDGPLRSFVSRRKAINGWIAVNHPAKADWHKAADKDTWKSTGLSHVRQGSIDAPTAAETRAAQDAARASPAPVAAQSSVSAKVSKADLVEQAVALGFKKSAAQKMTKDVLQATITALNNC